MFLVCGEALFDLFLRPSLSAELTIDARPGGSPFNVAFGLARLGQRVEFFSGLSQDIMGRKLARFMEHEGVGLTYAKSSSGPTALGLVELNEAGSPDYAFYGHMPAYQTLTEADLPDLPETVRVIHIGSIATVLEPTASTLAALAERQSGVRLVAYDPNVRPTIEPDLDVWRRTFERLSAAAHIVKVSAEDLALLYQDVAREAIAERCLRASARLVVITDGERGAAAWTRQEKMQAPPQPVDVIDTVGAGDSFQSALLAGLAETNVLTSEAIDRLSGNDLLRLLQFAGCAAAWTCSRRGADLPRRTAIPLRMA